MPELPEVEVRLNYLRRHALGKAIDRVLVFEPRLIKRPGPALFKRKLKGRRILAAERRGKYLLVHLDHGEVLILHFMMGGELAYYRDLAQRPRFTRIEFLLGDGGRLGFTCPRNICQALLIADSLDLPSLAAMGPEPLSLRFRPAVFRDIVGRSRNRTVKSVLMDQSRIAGIGNIYADQILFEAAIRPDRPVSNLSTGEADRLFTSIKTVLRRAVKTAKEDEFPLYFIASRGARGLGCPTCQAAIGKTKIGGRTTRFCSNCQV